MIHMSKNRLCDKNHLCGPHLVLVIIFQLGSGNMFQDASFIVSCCHLQHSLSTRKDCLCMRHATPCIRRATFASALQLHASAPQLLLQHFRNWKAPNKSISLMHLSKSLTSAGTNCTCLHEPMYFWTLHPCTLHLLSTLNRAPVSDTVTLICLHQSNWSCYYCAVGTS